MNILVLNSGSSSLKYQLIDILDESVLASGQVERIGMDDACITHKRFPGREDELRIERDIEAPDHGAAMRQALTLLTDQAHGVIQDADAIGAIGHRVLHSGEAYFAPTRIDDDVIQAVRDAIPLGPLHNPPGLLGIETALELFPGVPQVAVFDTAFHQTMPPRAFMYPLPYNLYEELHIRRYGFHGTSHSYVSHECAKLLNKPLQDCNMITLHLGNGSSITAIENGRCVDTSMGLTPLAGVMMGTRCGNIDPAAVIYLGKQRDMSFDELETLMTKESGLKGICGTSDMRDVHALIEKGDNKAQLALDMCIYRFKKYVGSYTAVLGRVDALVFTGGIGENDEIVRHGVCTNMERLGIKLDLDKNVNLKRGIAQDISAADSEVKVFVIPTNEELEIARQTFGVINK